METRKFGLGVIICVFNRDFSKILLIKRNEEKRKRSGADWGNVGGRVELGERLIDACLRETKEEIGVELNEKDLKLIEIKESPNFTEVFHALHFVYATTIAEEEDIKLNFACENESEEYQWFEVSSLPDKTLDNPEQIKEWRAEAIALFSEHG